MPCALAALASSIGGASAQQVPRVQVGVLECRGGASVGFVVGSVTNLGCVLRADGMPEDRYIATIRKVGLDLGITQELALAWGVFAPVARLGPGDLSGNYVGAQGSATLGVGVGGNVLVGGSANSIALQPLSVQGQVGISVAAGLESLELRPGRSASCLPSLRGAKLRAALPGHGDASVREALYQAAHVMLTKPVRNCTTLKGWAMRIARRAGPRKAKVALARKLAVILHRMLADAKPFNPPAKAAAT